jgi:mycoredoxin
MAEPTIDLYTTSWCPDCRVAKRVLREFGLDFREIDIEEDEAAAALVIRENQGKRRVPTIGIAGQFYGNPPPSQLRALLAAARNAAS